ncbi:MAG: AbrB/MazE/SpoVT family DNA-binding domain-containing protein [Candidatus Bathyarchaeia archaeon]
MRVGPKGQVVIPKAFRKALKIHPGSKVIFRLEGDRVVLQKLDIDVVSIFERIAKGGPSVKQIPTHLYEEELVERVG